ncbi:hypothetical protein ACFVT2_36830 [Streptomyces sp. NPDC058000]|uniref:hypothetical protein n=1 Tax=Streptomyces sp. NPDC058000 TaxID=3346299 RepID=UPI0036E276CB
MRDTGLAGLSALEHRPPPARAQPDLQRQQTSSPQVQEAPDVVIAVLGPTVHIRRVRFGSRRQRLRQCEGSMAETTETSSGMSQVQARQPEQRTTRHSPRPDLHAPVLYELRIIAVQRGPDQDSRRRTLC